MDTRRAKASQAQRSRLGAFVRRNQALAIRSQALTGTRPRRHRPTQEMPVDTRRTKDGEPRRTSRYVEGAGRAQRSRREHIVRRNAKAGQAQRSRRRHIVRRNETYPDDARSSLSLTPAHSGNSGGCSTAIQSSPSASKVCSVSYSSAA